jgi:TonB family protein
MHLLLGDFQADDVSKYRRREAAWVSLAVHACLILLLLFVPKLSSRGPVLVAVQPKKEPIFLDDQPSPVKVKPPKTDVVSDQNRVAQARVPSKETLRKILDTQRPGPPKAVTPPTPPAQAPQAAQQQAAPQAPQGQQSLPAQPQETAKLTVPQQPKPNPFAIRSAGSAVDQAIKNAANNPVHSSTSFGTGHYGAGMRPRIDTAGNFDILSDTLGVDFGPYMARLKYRVQEKWEPLIPESAHPPMMKKGRVVVEFVIMKDGTIQDMRMVAGSGDVALDTAAWGALTSSTPLPRLPVQFSGDYLRIRAAFYYNPDKNDFE